MKKIISQSMYVFVILLWGAWFGIEYVAGTDPIGLSVLAIIVIVLSVGVLRYQSPEAPTNSSTYDVDAARQAYTDGIIPLEEMERRVDIALDPRSKQLRKHVEDVDGVGPETSAALSAEYKTTEELANASQAELERIYGIGPNTAYAIKQRFSYEKSDELPENDESTSRTGE